MAAGEDERPAPGVACSPSLFKHNHQDSTRSTICSTMIARAFREVRFPVVPLVVYRGGKFRVLRRNPRLITPRDFDHSPYFSVIKYPLLGGKDRDSDIHAYREFPWAEHGSVYEERLQKWLDNLNVWCVKQDESDKRD